MAITRVAFIQGAGEGAHAADALLAASLGRELGDDFTVDFPLMPNESDPDYAPFRPVIASAVQGATVLVGHSLGGYFLLKHLTEDQPPVEPRVLCLIAAPMPGGDAAWTFPDFDLPADFGARLPADMKVFVYASEDDDIVPFAHRDLYAAAIPGAVTRTTTGGHQLGDDLSGVAADIRAALT